MAQILEKRLQYNLDSVCSISSVELAENHYQENVQEFEFMTNSNSNANDSGANIVHSNIVADDSGDDNDNDDNMDVIKNVSSCRQYVKSQSNKTSSSDSDVSDCIDGVETALREAFIETDKLFQQQDFENHDVIGSTALVMLLSTNSIYVGNVGDSRAVLCRNGEALPLSDDHKADRLDEMKRVKDLGGHILHWNGVRVMGILAMSRAIGDAQLKPYIIPDPEVTVVHRKKSDQIVIMASDGLWDVFDNQEACVLALRCLYRARQRGATRRAATRIAAAILAKAAIDRGSRDNVTVLVVDLKSKDNDFTKEEVQDAVRLYKDKKQQEDDDDEEEEDDDDQELGSDGEGEKVKNGEQGFQGSMQQVQQHSQISHTEEIYKPDQKLHTDYDEQQKDFSQLLLANNQSEDVIKEPQIYSELVENQLEKENQDVVNNSTNVGAEQQSIQFVNDEEIANQGNDEEGMQADLQSAWEYLETARHIYEQNGIDKYEVELAGIQLHPAIEVCTKLLFFQKFYPAWEMLVRKERILKHLSVIIKKLWTYLQTKLKKLQSYLMKMRICRRREIFNV
eukprot:TRINITY_DN33412_c0_g1_i3.p1 TRINITY_DN33412_c0_g1~~TRINITY_DN33412_c0_g1_i3.p1  ORF type:complete len:566 (-),score=115.09 TRINITY_DN33412_c0_g1_i3:789-2486(-)